MARRPGDSAGGTKPSLGRKKPPKSNDPPLARNDRLLELLDHCTAAQAAAEAIGEQFLVYLLGMAIEEANAAMRQVSPAAVQMD